MTRFPVEAYTPGVGEPVHRYKRNPRRAYDPAGREITPATIANSMENGARALRAECPCGHEAEIPIEHFPPESFVPDAGLRLPLRALWRQGTDDRTCVAAGERQTLR